MLKNFKIVDYINYLILIYAAVLSFPVQIKRIIVIAMILLWLSDRGTYKFKVGDPKNLKIFITFIAFILFMLSSYLWSDAGFVEVLNHIKRYWYFIPIYIIYKYIKKEYILYAINSFLLGMLVSETLSYGNFFGIWKIGLHMASTKDPSVFIQHTLYGIFLSICSIILFANILYTKEFRVRLFYGLFFISATTNLMINSGRTGYIVFFIVFFIIISYINKLNIKIVILTFFAILLTIFMAYKFSSNFHTRVNLVKNDITQIVKNKNYNTSVGARIGLAIIAKDIFVNHPILGAGAANNLNLKKEYIKKQKLKNFELVERLVHFHNSFLEILTQFGLVGLSIFIYLLYLVSQIKVKDKIMNIIKIATISVFVLGSLADMLFYLNATMSLFALMIGLVLAQNRYENLALK